MAKREAQPDENAATAVCIPSRDADKDWIRIGKQQVQAWQDQKPTVSPEGIEIPNAVACYWAIETIGILDLMDLPFSQVSQSGEGGIGIAFHADKLYADIEFFNSGEILAVLSDKKSPPQVWKVARDHASIRDCLERIREFTHP